MRLLLASLLLAPALVACVTEESSLEDQLADSRATFAELNQAADQTYTYVRQGKTAGTDYTFISFEEGVAVRRQWSAPEDNLGFEVPADFIEEGDQVGTTPGAFAALPYEALYDECAAVLAAYPAEQIQFRTFPNGALRDCLVVSSDDSAEPVTGVLIGELQIGDDFGCRVAPGAAPCAL